MPADRCSQHKLDNIDAILIVASIHMKRGVFCFVYLFFSHSLSLSLTHTQT